MHIERMMTITLNFIDSQQNLLLDFNAYLLVLQATTGHLEDHEARSLISGEYM